MAAQTRTNERSCITALFSKKSKLSETNDPQCKEDDIVALLWPFCFRIMKKNVFAIVRVISGRTRMRVYIG